MNPAENAIALCVGHSRFPAPSHRDGGAISVDGTSEWTYNGRLAELLAERLHDVHGINAIIVDDYGQRGYTGAMTWLAGKLRAMGDIGMAVELHFNSADGRARGHEWLHWASSKSGKRVATELHLAMGREFPQGVIPARGVKALGPADRGAEFLRRTHCPAVICEPFFGDNRTDWQAVAGHPHDLATAIAAGLAAGFAAIS